MKRKIYFNWLIIIMIPVGLFVFAILGFFILFPAANSSDWIIWGTFIITGITLSIWFSHISPFILILKDDLAFFIGFPWITRIKLEKIEKVIINNYSFSFIPKDRNDYKFVSSSGNGNYKGYKFISFNNLEAWGELIKFFKPISPGIDIRWKALNEKSRSYIEEKLYG